MREGARRSPRGPTDLAALTADIPADPATAKSARSPAPARRRPLARAASNSGICLIIAAAAIWVAFLVDPVGPGPNPYHFRAPGCFSWPFSP